MQKTIIVNLEMDTERYFQAASMNSEMHVINRAKGPDLPGVLTLYIYV